MSDKKAMFVIFTMFSCGVAYQCVTSPKVVSPSGSTASARALQVSLATTDCQDCVDSLQISCQIELDECKTSTSCELWLQCTDDCVTFNEGQECYDECFAAHLQAKPQCFLVNACVCEACVGQCLDMCMADE